MASLTWLSSTFYHFIVSISCNEQSITSGGAILLISCFSNEKLDLYPFEPRIGKEVIDQSSCKMNQLVHFFFLQIFMIFSLLWVINLLLAYSQVVLDRKNFSLFAFASYNENDNPELFSYSKLPHIVFEFRRIYLSLLSNYRLHALNYCRSLSLVLFLNQLYA